MSDGWEGGIKMTDERPPTVTRVVGKFFGDEFYALKFNEKVALIEGKYQEKSDERNRLTFQIAQLSERKSEVTGDLSDIALLSYIIEVRVDQQAPAEQESK